MPFAKYIAWVGTSLLALIVFSDWLFPQAVPEPRVEPSVRPVIRISSIEQLPERIVIDTSQPTIVPVAPLLGEVPDEPLPSLQAFASAVQPAPPAPNKNEKQQKIAKLKPAKAVQRPPTSLLPPVSAPVTAPPIKPSFIEVTLRQLGKSLFN
jgi:hypothetical protein